MGRLGLVLGLGSGPHVVGRLGSRPRVVGRLGPRVCRLADGGGGRRYDLDHVKRGELSGRGMCPGGNVLHSLKTTTLQK